LLPQGGGTVLQFPLACGHIYNVRRVFKIISVVHPLSTTSSAKYHTLNHLCYKMKECIYYVTDCSHGKLVSDPVYATVTNHSAFSSDETRSTDMKSDQVRCDSLYEQAIK